MEPLPPGWINERYSVDEAVAVVVWARYGGPHPSSGDPPSEHAKTSAERDIRPLVKTEILVETIEATPRPVRYKMAGAGVRDERPQAPERHMVERHVRYVDRADLAALCPGILPDPQPALSPIERRRADRILEIAQALDVDVLHPGYGEKHKIKVECLKDPRLFTEATFEHTWKARETWAKSPADIRPDSP
jgi:hypothetical protein